MTCLADHNTHVSSEGANRLLWLDASRTLALLAMVVFHFSRDLEIFGILPSGFTMTGGWAVFARVIAGAFLFLSGVSLIVAHGAGLRFHAWAKRLAMLVLAALLVSVGTYVAFPESYVYFGILHVIAACSLIGVLIITAPTWALIVSACLVLVADAYLGRQVFVSPWLAWTGLGSTVRPSLDFLPLVPWLAPFLMGMAFAKLVPMRGVFGTMQTTWLANAMTWPGRHSLAVYLCHQPVLLATIWVGTRII
ncbi:heparan-alpha-glucosaminide N-acetyltransferase [Tateyamaria pelophila]|uniref:heparan-alpha-glucosaminide N-acetyltransferase n=1 Tax=Tateyamaria pelophila TaxID=328415 RepID=UPI001CBAEAA8|nr:heparan-alpha-glucosaminide N-acetyltransferase [Tateyamaria pelophila]